MSVVEFPKREKLIYTCGHCGCATFYLYSDHTCECAGCEHISEGGEWVTPIESQPRAPEKSNAGAISVVAVGSVEMAKRRVLKKIADSAGDIALVAAWFENGAMSSWCGAETEEEKAWCVVKLDELAMKLAKKPVSGDSE